MTWIQPVTLRGQRVTLEPLSVDHAGALCEASRGLESLWYTAVPSAEGMPREIERRLALQAAGSMLPFALIDAAGVAVGMTTYMHVDAVHRRVEIGSTWVGLGAQRSGLNTEAKWLLLGHAFEQLGCIAVEFRTHRLNQQSRRAIERLGAQLDGILRSHQRSADGNLRDTCVYSVTAAEWPTVSTHLRHLLARPR
ncbi:MAG: GNAT family N-acetyltransferase [Leptothrix sp. (in: b-proteobacteria)]